MLACSSTIMYVNTLISMHVKTEHIMQIKFCNFNKLMHLLHVVVAIIEKIDYDVCIANQYAVFRSIQAILLATHTANS